ncbi:hypothetical protein ACLKA7_009563 [Drosophila subpalustris]
MSAWPCPVLSLHPDLIVALLLFLVLFLFVFLFHGRQRLQSPTVHHPSARFASVRWLFSSVWLSFLPSFRFIASRSRSPEYPSA